MNTKPLNLQLNDLIETRSNGTHCYFPQDRDTTERLRKVVAMSGDRYRPRYKVNPWIALFLLVGSLAGLVVLVFKS